MALELGIQSEKLVVPPAASVKSQSYRAEVLAVVNASAEWRTGLEIAILAKLSYKQTIDALCALHNTDKVARHGRTCAASWGSISLLKESESNFDTLESLFRKCIVRLSPEISSSQK